MSKYSDNKPPVLKDAIGWMFDHINDGSTFLDFGCSTGYFGSLIKKAKHAKVYGVEISDDVKEARKVLDGVYSFDLDGDWPDDIYERTYDYVFFGDVIEHLKDPGKVLAKCQRLLKKGGLLFVSTPNVAHIGVRLELLGGNFEYESMGILDSTHLKYFTKRSLTNLVQDAGYRIQLFDFTPNDYPDSAVTKLLDQYGLTPDEKFWQLVGSPEARAFQFKLILESSAGAKNLAVDLPAVVKPEIVRNAVVADLEQKVHSLDGHAKEQAKIIQHQLEAITRLEQENQAQAESLRHPLRHFVRSQRRP